MPKLESYIPIHSRSLSTTPRGGGTPSTIAKVLPASHESRMVTGPWYRRLHWVPASIHGDPWQGNRALTHFVNVPDGRTCGFGNAQKLRSWMRSIRISTTTTTKTSPSRPLGPYPQFCEWPHLGKPPTKSRIRMMSRRSPITLPLRQSRSWMEGRGRLSQENKPTARFMCGGP